MSKTSIVEVKVKVVVRHEPDQDPEDVIAESNYEFAIESGKGKNTPAILRTEIVETEDLGECDPHEFYLLEDQRRDEKRGLYPDRLDDCN